MADSDIKSEDLRNVIKSKASEKLPDPVAVIDSEDSYPFMLGWSCAPPQLDNHQKGGSLTDNLIQSEY